jgi:DNA polymerase elongation subunit (family B)
MCENDLNFQILDWSSRPEDSIDDPFTVRLFGRTDDDKIIFVKVTNFKPYFYVEIPSYISRTLSNSYLIDQFRVEFLSCLKSNIYKQEIKDSLFTSDIDIVDRHKFYGFTGGEYFKFMKISFKNYKLFTSYKWALTKQISIRGQKIKFKTYETSIEPVIRCMHCQNLQACGWVTIKGSKYKMNTPKETHSDLEVVAPFNTLEPNNDKENVIQKFTIAAVDIECISEDGSFPQATRDGDKIIMIATTFSRYGEEDCFHKNVIMIGDCNDIPNVDICMCKNEKELLIEWTKMIRNKNPDFITGWNIFGFDEMYIYERSKKLHIESNIARLSRMDSEQSDFTTKPLASSALGENILNYYNTVGRVHFDLMKFVQRSYPLASYKLDFVASYFFREVITNFTVVGENTLIKTNGTYGIKSGQYTTIIHTDGITDYEHLNGKKFKILNVTKDTILLEGIFEVESLKPFLTNSKHKVYWCQVKDDVKPKEIFSKFRGSKEDRTELALYNMQDCELCNKLTAKMQVIVDNICMANVCNVPLYYLFMRGQGVKIFSLVSKKCRLKEYLIPDLKKKQKTDDKTDKTDKNDEDANSFEGAIVFPPIPGMYLNPIFVLDFASLYPNSMRYRNLSHECIVLDDKYKNLPDYEYIIIEYNNTDSEKTTTTQCIFARKKEKNSMGILPEILTDLLNARASTRQKISNEPDQFKKKILDRMQLAYKVTANSLYGQTGATTSQIFMKEIAACTTATGRCMLKYSKKFIEEIFGNLINYAIDDKEKYDDFSKTAFKYVEEFNYKPDASKFKGVFDDCSKDTKSQKHDASHVCMLDTKSVTDDNWKKAFINALRKKIRCLMDGYHVLPKVIYGDTDSVFVDPHIVSNADGKLQTDMHSLEMAIQLGLLASMIICVLLPSPMKQEYEKCLYPFIQISKKRYVGNLYETNTQKYYQKSMGIVLKRRDNAQIVKIVCGGIIDQLLNKRDPKGAIIFARKTLSDIMKGKYAIDKFVITKTLKENYKNRNSISHAVLADRMAKRDPGNKPRPNDRIPYVFVVPKGKGKVKLQGERVETPDYVLSHSDMKIDYLYYITNQIMKPSLQFLELVAKNPKEIFDKCIRIEQNSRDGVLPVCSYF